MKVHNRFIVIDDDVINNVICSYIINKTETDLDIQTFNIPEKGLEYIINEYPKPADEIPTILFLDINMPSWTGWEFLENFDKLDENIKSQIRIYMLSSSIDQKDKDRALKNKNVVDYIVKPLKTEIVSNILMGLN